MNAGLFSLTLIIVPLSLAVILRSCHRPNLVFVFLPDLELLVVAVLPGPLAPSLRHLPSLHFCTITALILLKMKRVLEMKYV